MSEYYMEQYAAGCKSLKIELIESLTTTQIDTLRKEIATLGEEKWEQWYLKNLETIKQYVLAAPSKRRSLKKWQDPFQQRHLILGSIRYLTEAAFFLSRTEVYGLYPGVSYREMAAKAGWAYWDIQARELPPDWPFDDPNPFVEES